MMVYCTSLHNVESRYPALPGSVTTYLAVTSRCVLEKVLGHLRSSCAYKSKRAGWQGFWREHFCRTWREDLCHFSVFTHQFVSCFFFFSEPWKIRRPLKLSLTPTLILTLHTWISFHFFGGRQRSPRACITHCPTICAILTINDLEKMGGVSMQILPLASHRYYGARQRQAVDVFPRGDSEV